MWPVKCMAGSGIKGYHVLITGTKKILADDEYGAQEKKLLKLSYSTSQLIMS